MYEDKEINHILFYMLIKVSVNMIYYKIFYNDNNLIII